MRTSEKVMVATLIAILLPTALLIGMLLNPPEKDGGLLIPRSDGRVYIYQDANGTYYVFYSEIDVDTRIDVRIYRWNGTCWVEVKAIYKSSPPLYP